MPNLNTDFKDDILDISNPERKYQLIYNPDGTVSLRDVTVYQQTGSLYGAKEVNEERAAINKINNDRIVTLDEIDLVNQAGFFVDALAVKEINSALMVENTEINYQYYTGVTAVSNVNLNFKIGNIVHLQCGFKRNDGGKYPISTGLIHIQIGSHRPKNNLIIPAYIRVGNEWHPHYVYIRTNGEVHQDFSNNTEEILINGCYPIM